VLTRAVAAAASVRAEAGQQELRAQFERDSVVKSMIQRFGGKITEVKRNPEDPDGSQRAPQMPPVQAAAEDLQRQVNSVAVEASAGAAWSP